MISSASLNTAVFHPARQVDIQGQRTRGAYTQPSRLQTLKFMEDFEQLPQQVPFVSLYFFQDISVWEASQ